MATAEPYATTADLVSRWRPLSDSDEAVAAVLLSDASFWVRQWFPVETARIDNAAADGTGARILVCAMVKRAMLAANDDGMSSETQAYGPFSHTRAFSNPQGNLYITAAECEMIQGRSSGFTSMPMTGPW